MFFLNPFYLWALSALIIPVAIHLWSKKEGRIIKIGSIQLLKKADTQQSRSIKLSEIWLLVLRLFLISVLVLILAKPHITRDFNQTALTYIVEPSLLENEAFINILDTLANDVPIRLLQDDFPEKGTVARQQSGAEIPNYWQLAKGMQRLPTDSLIVFTKAYQVGFKGIRPFISKPVEWIPIPVDESKQYLLAADRFDEKIEFLSMNASNQETSFDKVVLSSDDPKIKWNTSKDSVYYLEQWTAVETKKTEEVLLFYNEDFLPEIKYFEAGFKVLAQYLNLNFNLLKVKESEQIEGEVFDIVIWLSEKKVLDTNGKVVMFKPNPSTNNLIERNPGHPNTYFLTRSLNPENIETDRLPEQLLRLLDLHPDIEKKIGQRDIRVLSKEVILPNYKVDKEATVNSYNLDLTKWLWFLFLLLLACERILSYYRSQ